MTDILLWFALVAVVLAMLAGPAMADECSDFRDAYILKDAARKALGEAAKIGDLWDQKEREERRAAIDVDKAATRALHRAAEDVRTTVEDKALLAIISDVNSAALALALAADRVTNEIRATDNSTRLLVAIISAEFDVQGAFHEVLNVHCRDYAP